MSRNDMALAVAQSAADGKIALLNRITELEAQVAKLQTFKDWVHNYLSAHGVPHHPPGPHGAEGCRIGDRMDWLMARINTLEQLVCDFQASGMIDVGDGGPCRVEPRHITEHVESLRKQNLALAERVAAQSALLSKRAEKGTT